jgi:F-type H+-transporting ATPase subunit b
MLASTALAAEAEHGGDEANLFAGDLGNAIFTLIIFLLVLFVLARFAWNPLLKALQNRERYIRESLESARRDREESERRLREYETRIARAHEEALAIIEEGRRDAESVKRRIEEEARKNADALIERARREIGIARDSALKDLYEQSAQLAITMAGSVLRRQISPEDQERLIGDALSELQSRGNGIGNREARAR